MTVSAANQSQQVLFGSPCRQNSRSCALAPVPVLQDGLYRFHDDDEGLNDRLKDSEEGVALYYERARHKVGSVEECKERRQHLDPESRSSQKPVAKREEEGDEMDTHTKRAEVVQAGMEDTLKVCQQRR